MTEWLFLFLTISGLVSSAMAEYWHCLFEFFGAISRFFVCCNLLGSLELVLYFGMVRSTSPELGARGNAKRGLGSLEILRGEFFSFLRCSRFVLLFLFVLGFSIFSVVTVFDDGIFVYSSNYW